MISGSKLIYNKLVKLGVTHVIGYSGGAVLPLLDQFYKSKNIKFIMATHEQGAGHIATGISRSGGLGVIVTTSGPGMTNLITPLYDAHTDGIKLLAMCGQVSTSVIGTDAFQECNSVELAKPCTKLSIRANSFDELNIILNSTHKSLTQDRDGPIYIDLPKDILLSEGKEYISKNNCDLHELISLYKPSMGKNLITFDGADMLEFKYTHNIKNINNIINQIKKSVKPVIIAGKGANHAFREIRELSQKFNIPVTTTLHGLGIMDETNKNSLGMIGMHGMPWANIAVQEADLILNIGSRFDDRTTGKISEYALNARIKNGGFGIIQIDRDKNRIDKLKNIINPDFSILGDSKKFCKLLLDNDLNNDRYSWENTIIKNKKNFNYIFLKKCNTTKLYAQDVIKRLNYYIDMKNTIITTGVGNHQMWTCQFINWLYPNTLLSSGSAGVMGVGVPFAIGAKLQHPYKTVICIDGDGSFNMTSQELKTIMEYNIPVKIIIMNDSRQQMVHVWQKIFCEERYIGTDNINPNYSKLAEAYNIKYLYCDNTTDLSNTLSEFMKDNDKPVILECKTVPDICLPLVAPNKALDDMILNYEQIENMISQDKDIMDIPS
jgi:acetolactate synthase-1/2/3 large subunit